MFSHTETRVWGLDFSGWARLGTEGWLSSTLLAGWGHLYGGIAVGELVHRYYAVGTGRFNTPDPGGVKTAKRLRPLSWNRYSYVLGDPINLTDRHGRDEDCDPDDEYGCDGDPCADDPFDPTCGPEPPGPGPGPAPAPPPPPAPSLVPTYLAVTYDCQYQGLTGTVRRRTYELLDQNYQPMGDGIVVSEQLSNVTPSRNLLPGGQWTTGLGDNPSSSFLDYYSDGTNRLSTNALQTYSAAFSGANYQLTVLEPNGASSMSGYDRYGTQGVFYSHSGIRIDNLWYNPFVPTNPGDNPSARKPCDPPNPPF